MNRVLFIFFLTSSLAFGSGKLSLQGNYYLQQKEPKPVIGFGIYEKLVGPIAYNGWTGIGWAPRVGEASVFWVTSRHDLEVWLGRLGISVGFTYRNAEQPLHGVELGGDHDVHVKLTYKLWD